MGLFEVVSHRQEVIDAKNEAIAAALTEIGMVAERFVKQEITRPKPHADGSSRPSVVTGELRRSIDFEVDAADESVSVGTNVEYGKFVEFGTSRSKDYPFLRPAVVDNMDKYQEIARKHLEGG